MLSDTVLAAVLLLSIGVGLLAVAASSWCRREPAGPGRRSGVVANALIGTLAVGDAAATVVDEPARVAHWTVGVLLVVLVVGAVVGRHHLRRRRERRAQSVPAVVVPAPRGSSEAYMPHTSAPT